jgi:hypothetical protein
VAFTKYTNDSSTLESKPLGNVPGANQILNLNFVSHITTLGLSCKYRIIRYSVA